MILTYQEIPLLIAPFYTLIHYYINLCFEDKGYYVLFSHKTSKRKNIHWGLFFIDGDWIVGLPLPVAQFFSTTHRLRQKFAEKEIGRKEGSN